MTSAQCRTLSAAQTAPALTTASRIRLGAGEFDARSGVLKALGGMDVDGPRLDLWRAPIDNDELGFSVKPAAQWREAGLHRMHHKTLSVDAGESGLNVRERVAAAGVGHGMDVAYRWTVGDDGTLWLTVDLEPHGAWPCTLPRRGVALTLPGSLEHVEWFGAGPGEAYRDTGNDARIGRFRATVVEMQTP